MAERTFPVLWQGPRDRIRHLEAMGCPRTVPWDFVAEHRSECLRNHDQTPERLAERGGLGPEEIMAVVDAEMGDPQNRYRCWHLSPEKSVPWLKAAVAEWVSRRTKA